eukprot:TRINITY_DN10407_c0_g1_i1.p1 TRINITY_DN10407_c0_g1~~TRINITY_DN10407_c0_g1_i1.p1  ORF type:complete len:945 (-),score=79.11 TRINITY_DN10407_c0_g1_i1:142-2976(-)
MWLYVCVCASGVLGCHLCNPGTLSTPGEATSPSDLDMTELLAPTIKTELKRAGVEPFKRFPVSMYPVITDIVLQRVRTSTTDDVCKAWALVLSGVVLALVDADDLTSVCSLLGLMIDAELVVAAVILYATNKGRGTTLQTMRPLTIGERKRVGQILEDPESVPYFLLHSTIACLCTVGVLWGDTSARLSHRLPALARRFAKESELALTTVLPGNSGTGAKRNTSVKLFEQIVGTMCVYHTLLGNTMPHYDLAIAAMVEILQSTSHESIALATADYFHSLVRARLTEEREAALIEQMPVLVPALIAHTYIDEELRLTSLVIEYISRHISLFDISSLPKELCERIIRNKNNNIKGNNNQNARIDVWNGSRNACMSCAAVLDAMARSSLSDTMLQEVFPIISQTLDNQQATWQEKESRILVFGCASDSVISNLTVFRPSWISALKKHLLHIEYLMQDSHYKVRRISAWAYSRYAPLFFSEPTLVPSSIENAINLLSTLLKEERTHVASRAICSSLVPFIELIGRDGVPWLHDILTSWASFPDPLGQEGLDLIDTYLAAVQDSQDWCRESIMSLVMDKIMAQWRYYMASPDLVSTISGLTCTALVQHNLLLPFISMIEATDAICTMQLAHVTRYIPKITKYCARLLHQSHVVIQPMLTQMSEAIVKNMSELKTVTLTVLSNLLKCDGYEWCDLLKKLAIPELVLLVLEDPRDESVHTNTLALVRNVLQYCPAVLQGAWATKCLQHVERYINGASVENNTFDNAVSVFTWLMIRCPDSATTASIHRVVPCLVPRSRALSMCNTSLLVVAMQCPDLIEDCFEALALCLPGAITGELGYAWLGALNFIKHSAERGTLPQLHKTVAAVLVLLPQPIALQLVSDHDADDASVPVVCERDRDMHRRLSELLRDTMRTVRDALGELSVEWQFVRQHAAQVYGDQRADQLLGVTKL